MERVLERSGWRTPPHGRCLSSGVCVFCVCLLCWRGFCPSVGVFGLVRAGFGLVRAIWAPRAPG
jgi:hypothetical protein